MLFLVLSFALGIGIKLYKSAVATELRYDYSASDSEFAKRSRVSTATDSISVADTAAAETNHSYTVKESTPDQPININTASKDELVKLPGIGEAMAERIVLYRDENGPFASVDQLTNVKGIGKKKLERIAPVCTVGK